MTVTKNITIVQGDTFSQTLFWETTPYVYKAITAVTKTAPAQITAVAHGLVSGWRAAVVSVVGMSAINSSNSPPKDKDFHEVTVMDVNTILLNDVNSALYAAYVSGGYLQSYTQVDMAGYTARMAIKTAIGGTLLLTLDTTTGSIVVNNTTKTITLILTAVATAALTWSTGVYDLEMVSPTGAVTKLITGTVTVSPEVTT